MSQQNRNEKNVCKQEEIAAQEEIWKYILGFTPMAVIKCAIELRIPDILESHESPITLADLSLKVGCSESSLHRIMRFLINYNVFQEKTISETSIGYAQTPISRLLTRHGKHSMADLVILENSPIMLDPWHKLSAWVLSNKDLPFDAVHGKDIWVFNAENPGHNKLFNDAMACGERVTVPVVLSSCAEVFDGVTTIVDVGGGDGTALRLIVESCPWIKGINFDLPHVVSRAPAIKGVEHVGGNMFDHVPKADAVYMMKIMHDWADEECIHILRKCREAIPQDTGKVIIVDAILGREEDHQFKSVGLLLDMAMIAHTSKGKERTLNEWSYLFNVAGFTRHTIKHIPAIPSVFEIYP